MLCSTGHKEFIKFKVTDMINEFISLGQNDGK